MASEIEVTLTDDEALVVYEWLQRQIESGPTDVQDQAELRAIWNLAAALEDNLVAVVLPDYVDLVQRARNRLRDQE